MEGVRSRIKTLYNVPPGTEVFLCPSGSDAEYIPLLIAKTLNKGRKIVNVVTCDAEVRSGVSIPVSALFSLSLSLSLSVSLSHSLTHRWARARWTQPEDATSRTWCPCPTRTRRARSSISCRWKGSPRML